MGSEWALQGEDSGEERGGGRGGKGQTRLGRCSHRSVEFPKVQRRGGLEMVSIV